MKQSLWRFLSRRRRMLWHPARSYPSEIISKILIATCDDGGFRNADKMTNYSLVCKAWHSVMLRIYALRKDTDLTWVQTFLLHPRKFTEARHCDRPQYTLLSTTNLYTPCSEQARATPCVGMCLGVLRWAVGLIWRI